MLIGFYFTAAFFPKKFVSFACTARCWTFPPIDFTVWWLSKAKGIIFVIQNYNFTESKLSLVYF